MKNGFGRSLSTRSWIFGLVFVLALTGGVVSVLHFWPRLFPASTTVAGPAETLDGATVRVSGVALRLRGIDAPVKGQRCWRSGEPWRCDEAATAHLKDLIRDRPVVCTRTGVTKNGHVIAVCRSPDGDLGQRMVEDGLAVSLDTSYLPEEAEASREHRGLWAGEFERPHDWRKSHKVHAP